MPCPTWATDAADDAAAAAADPNAADADADADTDADADADDDCAAAGGGENEGVGGGHGSMLRLQCFEPLQGAVVLEPRLLLNSDSLHLIKIGKKSQNS
ncbi:MAG: hypothetical protein ACKPFE_13795 [Dolichospermum sp.]